MGITSCNINSINYPVRGSDDQGFQFDDVLEVPGALQVVVQDANGTANFERGDEIELVDSVEGVIYSGTILSSKPLKASPDPTNTYTEHTVTCIDRTEPLTRLPNTTNYENWYGGDIAVDMVVNGGLKDEGITVAAGLHRDSTNDDFNTGINNNVQGTLTVGDGCLELAPAGSDITYSERTTADFSTGTLTNVTASNNQLTPNIQNALKFSAFLPISTDASAGSLSSFIQVKFWAASPITLGASDTLNFDVWVSDSNPEKVGNCILIFSDNTNSTGVYDQNGVSTVSSTDLSGYAVNQWYTRQISLAAYSGKTIVAVCASCSAFSVGTYTWYLKNVYLSSLPGNKFFSTTQTTPQLNPPQIYRYAKFITSTLQTAVVTTFDPNNSYRISTSLSIDPVKLIKSTNIFWNASESVLLYVTYNGGSSWIACTNNAPLPGLPAGANVAGMSMQLKEVFGAGDTPDALSVLESVSVSILSAPNATKSDIVTSFLTQANWNTGTHSATQADVSGNLELAPFTRDWSSGGTTGQTAFLPSGTSQSVTGGAYTMTVGDNDATGANGFGTSRLDSLGAALNFTLECDLKSNSSFEQTGITYRQIYWNASVNNTFGYLVFIQPGSPGWVELGYGSNSNSDSYTAIANTQPNISTNTFYHIKIVVNGSRHQVYFNNATTPTIDVTDTHFTQSGGFGFRGYHIVGDSGAKVSTWDNLVLAQQQSGTWTGPSTPISSLVTCGGSVITWQETGTDNPAAAYDFVQSSIDGGSTYQQCVNGGVIPGLTNGVSLSGKSVLIQVLLGTQTNTAPMVRGLVWRVLGQYPGSSGTRSTKPLGIDYVDRANQSGFGTASDSQVWTPTGTATAAVASNKLTITNTTGDFFERLGLRTDDDMDMTVPFTLSASTMTGGMTLRYVDTNNYYKLQASTTSIDIVKKVAGVSYTLVSVASTLTINTQYYMRFRVVNQMPVDLYGRIWLAGTLEDQENWTINTSD
jgi:hypothetical protein